MHHLYSLWQVLPDHRSSQHIMTRYHALKRCHELIKPFTGRKSQNG